MYGLWLLVTTTRTVFSAQVTETFSLRNFFWEFKNTLRLLIICVFTCSWKDLHAHHKINITMFFYQSTIRNSNIYQHACRKKNPPCYSLLHLNLGFAFHHFLQTNPAVFFFNVFLCFSLPNNEGHCESSQYILDFLKLIVAAGGSTKVTSP